MSGPLFPQTVLDSLAESGDRACFEHGDRIVTGTGTLSLIRRVAAGMRAAGFGRGTGIALLPGTSPEGFAAMLAAYTLGLRVSAVRPGLTPAQFAHLVAEGVDAIVVDPEAAPAELIAAAAGTPVYALGPYAGAHDLLVHDDDGAPLEPAGRPDDVVRITYTSGSTGTPKGVATTYHSLGKDWPWRPEVWTPAIAQIAAGMDRYLLFGTLASPVAFDYAVLSLFHGGVVVIPDAIPQPFFPDVIERYRITGSIMSVPRLYQMLDRQRERPVDLSSLRALMVSGSPLSPPRYADALALLGPVVYQAYGQTEAGAFTLLTPAEVEHVGEAALTSVGRPHPFVDVSIRDERDRPVPAGETGEIYVRTPYQGRGYWRDPVQSAQVYADGWVRTRDLGHLDADGYLHLAGRTRDVIIVNAMIYYAGPIEHVLARHPDVDQAYVTGAPDDRTGEAIHAFVVPARGRTPDRAALAKFVRAELGDASVPATITLISEVIAGPSGKPDKKALLAHYHPAN